MKMDYVQPTKLIEQLVVVGEKKASLSVRDMLLRGFLSGVLLGFAAALAFRVSDGFTGGGRCTGDGDYFSCWFCDDRTAWTGIGDR